MDAMELVKAMSVLLPIVGLVVTGFAITLQSGVANLISHQGLRQVAWNLSKAVLLLMGWMASFLILQQLSGVHMGLLG
jgi:hypothetical protein